MKSHRFLPILALLLLAAPAAFAASFGVRAGRTIDSDANFVGAELLIDLGRLNINPNVEYEIDQDVTAGSGNIDLTYDLGTFGRLSPYVGAGVGLRYLDDEVGTTETDLVGNLIGGIGFQFASLKPYAQVKYFRVIEDENNRGADDVSVAVGLRF
jgi:opacity protein-like surface antigen